MGIQMKQKELTKTFLFILNWTKPFFILVCIFQIEKNNMSDTSFQLKGNEFLLPDRP